jgi:HTH-type transcriptional regulator/antitoxin HigA
MPFRLETIHDEKHLEEAQRALDQVSANTPLSEGEELYLDELSDLVGAYEDEHYPIAPPSDADMLRHLIEARGITQAQLSRDTSIPKSTISEVLAGKRPFSRQLIRRLASYFKVDVSVLAANI